MVLQSAHLKVSTGITRSIVGANRSQLMSKHEQQNAIVRNLRSSTYIHIATTTAYSLLGAGGPRLLFL